MCEAGGWLANVGTRNQTGSEFRAASDSVTTFQPSPRETLKSVSKRRIRSTGFRESTSMATQGCWLLLDDFDLAHDGLHCLIGKGTDKTIR